MSDFIKANRHLFENNGAVLVTHAPDVFYLAGFQSSNALLLLTAKENFLITDTRYHLAAKSVRGYTVLEENLSIIDRAVTVANKLQAPELAYMDETLSAQEYLRLKKSFTGHLVPLGDLFTWFRAVKNPAEFEYIRRAQNITDEAFTVVLGKIEPGITEIELAAELEYQMRRRGSGGTSFDTIVASGENSARPHAVPGERKLQPGDFITMDMGCRYHNYCSDMTRTVVLGKATAVQKKLYATVLEAQKRGLDALAPGVCAKEVDKIARDYIKDEGYGAFFGHGLGHGVGIEIHEKPVLNARSETILKPGHVVTVEPGIYVPGVGGARIEDLCYITENGYHNFTQSEKYLIEL